MWEYSVRNTEEFGVNRYKKGLKDNITQTHTCVCV